MMTVWTVVRRFLLLWVIAALVIVIVSCVQYREYIVTACADNLWSWVDAALPTALRDVWESLPLR